MPDRDLPSIENEEQYEALRRKGMSKEKAARIANSENTGGDRPYEERTKEELYELARKIDLAGRSQMTKAELIRALRAR
jgi:hypothetical protein